MISHWLFVVKRFVEPLLKNFAGLCVGGFSGGALFGANPKHFGLPAYIDRRQAPAGAAAAARIGWPSSSTNTGLVCELGKIRTAIQLEIAGV